MDLRTEVALLMLKIRKGIEGPFHAWCSALYYLDAYMRSESSTYLRRTSFLAVVCFSLAMNLCAVVLPVNKTWLEYINDGPDFPKPDWEDVVNAWRLIVSLMKSRLHVLHDSVYQHLHDQAKNEETKTRKYARWCFIKTMLYGGNAVSGGNAEIAYKLLRCAKRLANEIVVSEDLLYYVIVRSPALQEELNTVLVCEQTNIEFGPFLCKLPLNRNILRLRCGPTTDYEYHEDTIGRGSFGKVQQVRRKNDTSRDTMVAKTYHTRDGIYDYADIIREIAAFAILRHPNVARAHEFVWVNPKDLFVIMPYFGVPLIRLTTNLPKTILKLSLQLMQALDYLHKMRFVHRDVTSGNIFVDGERKLTLGDFGSVRYIGNGDKHGLCEWTNPVCAAFHRPPEMVLCDGPFKGGYTFDVWSAGVCICEMVTDNVPSRHENTKSMIEEVFVRKTTIGEKITQKCGALFSQLVVDRMLVRDPMMRASAAVCSHEIESIISLEAEFEKC